MIFSKLQSANRLLVFKYIAVDELNNIDPSILNHIAGPSYPLFLDTCDTVFENKDKIKDVTCSNTEGSLNIEIIYKK